MLLDLLAIPLHILMEAFSKIYRICPWNSQFRYISSPNHSNESLEDDIEATWANSSTFLMKSELKTSKVGEESDREIVSFRSRVRTRGSDAY